MPTPKLEMLVSSIKIRTGLEFQIKTDRLVYKGNVTTEAYHTLYIYLTKKKLTHYINIKQITIEL